MTRIDLHCHSTASDGTLTPAELVRAGLEAGLDVMAITDHDTTGGWAEAAAARPPGLALVRGAELSCRWYGVEPAIPLHMLAYLFDPEEPALAADLARLRTDREQRAERIVELLRADGVDISWPEVYGYAAGGSVGRPHIAQALIRAGLVRTTDEAFASRWLGARYFVPKEDLDVFEAVQAIRAAGGVAVFAHPNATVRGRIVPDKLIVELAAAGLFGLEADHEDHTVEQRAQVRALAEKLGLVVTGSSDFHGRHKTVQLGAFGTAPDAYARIAAAATGVPVLG
ncbi:PHP domain-containing protein [Amorphoplanes digitatis]|uniref:Putative metal-dependent phosphoesterase TrpH n=1 Tax=Actinoplanes digitatis TaxID=1868 RepID=A0A7W7HSB6_9ACTN|nr:PHP domain-containing protein [Actinoplanes digitatis]MBB4759753.1 putative metal-dependent phosphoesterase TrpH [Actinoplanes digitatis]GID94359.1 phosphatase [Actinoplanes digitatis]